MFPPVTQYTHLMLKLLPHLQCVVLRRQSSRTMLMSKHTLTWHNLTDIHIRLPAMEINNSERPHMHIPYITTSPHGVSPCAYRGIQMSPGGQLIKWCLDNSAPENPILGSISQVSTVIQDLLMLLITTMRKRSWRTRKRNTIWLIKVSLSWKGQNKELWAVKVKWCRTSSTNIVKNIKPGFDKLSNLNCWSIPAGLGQRHFWEEVERRGGFRRIFGFLSALLLVNVRHKTKISHFERTTVWKISYNVDFKSLK